ncbi:hypothetical protein HDV63DRAFT_309138 [Trichoderma sp. SZMC 28014]
MPSLADRPGPCLEDSSTCAGASFAISCVGVQKLSERLQASSAPAQVTCDKEPKPSHFCLSPKNKLFGKTSIANSLGAFLALQQSSQAYKPYPRQARLPCGHHFYPSSPHPRPLSDAKETPLPLSPLSNCRALADAGWGSSNQGVALLHNTICSKPQ